MKCIGVAEWEKTQGWVYSMTSSYYQGPTL